MGRILLAVSSLLLAMATACAKVEASDFDPHEALRNATVTVANRCAGVVTDDSRHVVTAAHCINGEEALPIVLADGTPLWTRVRSLDRRSDVAILTLDAPAPVRGLAFAESLPEPGTSLLFASRVDWNSSVQSVIVVRHGRCPTLPGVPAALFTSLRGKPGDSGAPVVDTQMRVVGLVHGGAACSIAAPTHEVPAKLRGLPPNS